MTRNCHDRLLAGFRFRKLGNRVVSQIVKTQPRDWAFQFVNISIALGVAANLRWTLYATARRAFYGPR